MQARRHGKQRAPHFETRHLLGRAPTSPRLKSIVALA
jgi:hypothetical protein